jgi:hypothetical protein
MLLYNIASERLEVTVKDNRNGLLSTHYTTDDLLKTFTEWIQRNDYSIVEMKRLYEYNVHH